MKNIHILPTDKPSRLYKTGSFLLLDSRTMPNNTLETKNQYIYITSDEEIKVGDWFLPQGHINPHKLKEYNKINGDLESYNGLCYDISKCKKIILTTDQDLIKDGVQAIDDEFLEWFVKNPSCDEVKVKYDKDIFPYGVEISNGYGWYKIIIPKEEPKQETLEEAAEREYAAEGEDSIYCDLGLIQQDAFIVGAKWQAERMYSEEDMIEFGFSTYCYISELMGVPFNLMSENRLNAEEWFKQFKKK